MERKMRYNQLLLVIPSPDEGMKTEYTSTGTVVPIGVCSIATNVRKHFPNLEIEVYDDDIEKQSELEKIIKEKADDKTVVGISCKTINHENSKRIGKIAKENDALVVIGGQYVSSRGLTKFGKEIVPSAAKDILFFNPFYDISVAREGEKALVEIIKNIPLNKINNICYRDNNILIENNLEYLNLDSLPIADRSFVKKYLNKYSENYRKQFQSFKDYKHKYKIAFYSQKGCFKAVEKVPCTFCSIYDVDEWRSRNPKNVLKELEILKEKYNDIVAYDICDDFLGNLDYFNEYYKTLINKNIPTLRIYLRADRVNREILDKLKKINVDEVFIGFESASEQCLKKSAKKIEIEENLKAVKLLAENDFLTNIGTIFGLKGENKDSVNATLDFIKDCASIPNFRHYVNITLFVPYRGCIDYFKLYRDFEKYRKEEFRNNPKKMMIEGIKDWNKLYCKIDLDYIENAISEGLKYTLIGISMSRTLSSFSLKKKIH